MKHVIPTEEHTRTQTYKNTLVCSYTHALTNNCPGAHHRAADSGPPEPAPRGDGRSPNVTVNDLSGREGHSPLGSEGKEIQSRNEQVPRKVD